MEGSQWHTQHIIFLLHYRVLDTNPTAQGYSSQNQDGNDQERQAEK